MSGEFKIPMHICFRDIYEMYGGKNKCPYCLGEKPEHMIDGFDSGPWIEGECEPPSRG